MQGTSGPLTKAQDIESQKPVLVIGMSHIGAIAKAMTVTERRYFKVINIKNSPEFYNWQQKTIHGAQFRIEEPKLALLSIGGNFGSIVSLFENPIPMAIGDKIKTSIPADENRHFIPFDMFATFFRNRLTGTLDIIRQIAEALPDVPKYHLTPPPPIGDLEHIRKYPGLFQDQMHMPLAPDDFRLKVYRLQCAIYDEYCENLGVGIIRPPEQAVDERGLLASDYWANDPTHGNEEYGRLVLGQIKEIENGLAK